MWPDRLREGQRRPLQPPGESRQAARPDAPEDPVMKMIVFEDAGFARLGPLAQNRPVFELRCGAVSLVERPARRLADDEVGALVRPELTALCRWAWPDRPVNDPHFCDDSAVL